MVQITPTHLPGLHCASTGVRDLLAHHGISLSEAMCFGLGAGLGIWYFGFPDKKPSRMVHVRSAEFESDFFNRIGHPFVWEKFETPQKSQDALIEKIDKGRPALLQTDIFHLPYYGSKTHFPGHAIVCWGYDWEKQVFFVSDTERDNLCEVPFGNMAQARFCGGGFFHVKGNMFAPEILTPPQDMGSIIRAAVLENSSLLMARDQDNSGVRALETWKNELDLWKDFSDWQWTARFAYQTIEKRGTGGGGFRLMYSRFLSEASKFVPKIGELGLPAKMEGLAKTWTRLALALAQVSEQSRPEFGRVEDCLNILIDQSFAYHEIALLLAE